MRHSLGTSASLLALGLAAALLAPPAHADHPRGGPEHRWHHDVVDPDQSFRGLDAVDGDTAWISGGSLSKGGPGRVYRTADGGESWQDVSPAGSDGLMFRDVEARDVDTAVVLAIGEGEASRIYRTEDGGESWTEAFRNTEPTAFYNCLAFYPGGQRGLAVSDPVDGTFRILATEDGGRSWEVLPDEGMPDSTGEYNFSASGECLTISGRDAWFGTGGSAARVFHSRDGGLTWEATDSAIPAGDAAGVFALAFRGRHGIAVGGDFAAPADGTDASAYSHGGRSWRGGGNLEHLGEDVAWLSRRHLVAVGEGGDVGGVSVSRDAGRSWRRVSDVGFHTLDCTTDACWAAGGNGRFGRVGR